MAATPRDPAAANDSSSPCEALDPAVDGTESGVAFAESRLTAARCLLVIECARPLSEELHGMSAGRPRVAVAVDRAGILLDRAAEALKDPAIEADARRTLADRIELLRAFARMFSALASADDSDTARARLTDACIGLSAFIDGPNGELVDSVKLWQTVAYRRAGRPDRALKLLRPALGRPAFTDVYFMACVERCRALADRGMYVAALSLAHKLAERTDRLPRDDGSPLQPRAAAGLRRLVAEIHRRWAGALRERGQPELAAAAERQAADILAEDEKTPAVDRLLYLDETVAGLPEWSRIKPRATNSGSGLTPWPVSREPAARGKTVAPASRRWVHGSMRRFRMPVLSSTMGCHARQSDFAG